MPVGIARICNDARRPNTRFYVPHSVEHCTREGLHLLQRGPQTTSGGDSGAEIFWKTPGTRIPSLQDAPVRELEQFGLSSARAHNPADDQPPTRLEGFHEDARDSCWFCALKAITAVAFSVLATAIWLLGAPLALAEGGSVEQQISTLSDEMIQ